MRFTAPALILFAGVSSTAGDREPENTRERFIPERPLPPSVTNAALERFAEVAEGPVSPRREASDFFITTCTQFGVNLNDMNSGLFLLKASELIGRDSFVRFTGIIRGMQLSNIDLLQLCASLVPVARIGHEAFTHGWEPSTEIRARDMLDGIARSFTTGTTTSALAQTTTGVPTTTADAPDEMEVEMDVSASAEGELPEPQVGVRAFVPRPEQAYRFFDSECARFNMYLNDQSQGYFICKASELVAGELVALMDKVHESEMSEAQLANLCNSLKPLARIGHEAFTRGWSQETVERAKAVLEAIPE